MTRATPRPRSTHDLFFPPDPLQQELRRRQEEGRRKQGRAKPPAPSSANLREQVRIFLEHADLINVLEWALKKAPHHIRVRAFQADARRRVLVDKLKPQS